MEPKVPGPITGATIPAWARWVSRSDRRQDAAIADLTAFRVRRSLPGRTRLHVFIQNVKGLLRQPFLSGCTKRQKNGSGKNIGVVFQPVTHADTFQTSTRHRQ